MAGYNLVRNAEVFFTTNLNATNAVLTSGNTNANCFELQVASGFTFSQGTQTQTIKVNEAGSLAARSQRTFNTSQDPVDFSFTTYMRPNGTAPVNCEEKVLWNALLSKPAINSPGFALTLGVTSPLRAANAAFATFTTAAATNYSTAGIYIDDVVTVKGIGGAEAVEWNMPAVVTSFVGGTNITGTDGKVTNATATGIGLTYLKAPTGTSTTPSGGGTAVSLIKGAFTQQVGYSLIHSGGSNTNQLQPFGLIISLDDITYIIDNCVLDQATIDFGLDGIAQIAWTGKGTKLTSLGAALSTAVGTAGTFGGVITGTYLAKDVNAQYITRKLSTMTLKSTLRGLGTSPVVYTVALTGGTLTITNNVTFVTPENLGTVNAAIGYFTGTRAISGNVTAYLKSGASNSGGLLATMLSNIGTAAETKYYLQIEVGGKTNGTRVEIELPAVMLHVPTLDTQDIISTSIGFTAQGFDGSSSAAASMDTANFDVEKANDLFVRYYSAA